MDPVRGGRAAASLLGCHAAACACSGDEHVWCAIFGAEEVRTSRFGTSARHFAANTIGQKTASLHPCTWRSDVASLNGAAEVGTAETLLSLAAAFESQPLEPAGGTAESDANLLAAASDGLTRTSFSGNST